MSTNTRLDRRHEERFWTKVDRTGGQDSCWEWKEGCSVAGYGSFASKGKCYIASRVAYQLTHGEIPDGMCVCHKCDNRKCCRPDHLFLGTVADNNKDKTLKGRQARGQNHALKGEAAPYSKLTWADVCSIRARRTSGEPLQSIAKDFKIAMQTVSKIHKQIIWRVQK